MIYILLFLLFAKHYLCDFQLQNSWMANGKGKEGFEFILPLAAHCGIHSLGLLFIVLIFNKMFWWLIIIEFVTHFLIDRLKAVKKYEITDKKFWLMLGLDQFAHYSVYIFYVFILLL